MERFFQTLKRPVRKNLVLLVQAFLDLTAALRSGNGELTLAAISRALPVPTSFKDRYKRLNRFLDNVRFDPQSLTEGLLATLLGVGACGLVPVLLDQSSLGVAQLLVAGLPQAGRILPLALWVFTYADIQNHPDREKSRNFIERLFILRLLEAVEQRWKLCFILDRGYARVSLIRELLCQPQVLFVLRAPRNVLVWRRKHGRWTRCRLGALRARDGQPRRLERILYHSQKPVEVDLVIYYQRGHQQPWYLILPPGSSQTLPTWEVVHLYRRRMHVEQGFRDFKTHLGIRGLRLQVRISLRIQRLLQAFTLAYALVVSLGMTQVAEQARPRLEDDRCASRHDTTRILSARTVAALLLAGVCAELLAALARTWKALIQRTLAGRGLYYSAPFL